MKISILSMCVLVVFYIISIHWINWSLIQFKILFYFETLLLIINAVIIGYQVDKNF